MPRVPQASGTATMEPSGRSRINRRSCRKGGGDALGVQVLHGRLAGLAAGVSSQLDSRPSMVGSRETARGLAWYVTTSISRAGRWPLVRARRISRMEIL